MGTLTWSDELASAAQKYAEKNPSGHNAFNSTPASRIAEVGSHRGMAESIDYVGYTGVLATYRLFIDSNVPSLGHRTMMIKPELTHLGVGCSYIKQTDRVTCVLKYATDFVPKADEPKFEVGKQYVVPVLGGSFQFFKVRSINRNGIQLDLCPDLRASMTISGPAGVTTVNNARRLGLTTTNEPCDESSVPPGVMNNGTQLPKSVPATSAPATKTPSAPASTAPAATAAPSAAPPATPAPLPGATTPAPNQPANTSTPVDDGSGPALKLEMGKVYAIREDPASKNVRYFKLLTFRGSARVAEREYTFLVCSDLNGTLTVWGTPTSLNATVFEPSEVKSRGFTATNEPCTTTRGNVSLTMGAQYAYREAGNTFRYVKIMRTRGGHQSVSLSVCPNANPNAMTTMSFGSIDQASQQIVRVDDALGDDLVPTNQACDATKTPFGR